MKALTSPLPHRHRMRRVSKPVMEKRRRDRINRSLETLRVLMLENTHNEKLTNPKVEKAEILESVVQFLKSEKEERGQRAITPGLSSQGQRPSGPQQQHDYQEGMRSCLLRIRRFIASDEPGSNRVSREPASVSPSPHVHSVYPAHLSQHQLQDTTPHPYPSQGPEYQFCDIRKLLPPPTTCAQSLDPVWRPWPQS
ncbi:hairy-related 5 [Syngnathus scovelli]|uniref:hairy-related 5 n=1 Tax=Syngnathus scovelli TaxID=161590 RepID=UPI002110CB39|nr:hairy-related 5 [Syngnathus scovelli]